MEILEKLQEAFRNNVWKPELLTMVDSDPRWRAIDLIEKEKGIKVEWDWEHTDFSKLGCNPIVVEFSSTKEDEVKLRKGIQIVKKILEKTQYEIIIGKKIIVILKEGKENEN